MSQHDGEAAVQEFQIDRDDVERAVAECGLFDSVTDEARAALLASFEGVRIVTGETLLREGDPADHLYIVRHGRLRATVVDADGADVMVGEIGKGEVVGEMAVITDQDRSATVRAMRDTDLFRLPAVAFGRLVQDYPAMLRPFASVVVDRLRQAMLRPARPALPATIVLVPTGSGDTVAFANALAEQLTDFTTVVLTGDGAADRTNAAAWLLDIENQTEISLLVADPDPTPWTQLCLRHADRINLIASPDDDPAPTAVERDAACAARFDEVPTHLVMCDRRRPAIGPWLAARRLDSHINIDPTDRADLGRLARVMTGTANIAVLGGGGARGFAHFGVLRALDEADVPIDGIIGTSAGAVAGGLIALSSDVAEAERMALAWFDSVRWRRDFTPPRVALTSGRTMSEALRSFSDGIDIEQLAVNYAAVSCDLVTAKPFIHDRGPLWQAMRSSGSVPGIFPPLLVDGRLLVDGGLIANMPTDIARERHPNARLIAVDVGDPAGIVTGGSNPDGIVNGWDRLRRRTSADTVTLSRLLMRLTELGRNDSTDSADVTIRPDVRGFGITETSQAREIIRRGYEAGRSAVEAGAFDSSNS